MAWEAGLLDSRKASKGLTGGVLWCEQVVGYACGWGEELFYQANRDGSLFGDLVGKGPIC
jgi:hypothetical protein